MYNNVLFEVKNLQAVSRFPATLTAREIGLTATALGCKRRNATRQACFSFGLRCLRERIFYATDIMERGGEEVE